MGLLRPSARLLKEPVALLTVQCKLHRPSCSGSVRQPNGVGCAFRDQWMLIGAMIYFSSVDGKLKCGSAAKEIAPVNRS